MIKVKPNPRGAWILLACALFSICSAGTAKADSLIYIPGAQTFNYSGEAFTECYGSYSTNPAATQSSPGPCNGTYFISGSITLSFVYSGWDAYSTPSADLGLTSLSFTDNGNVTLNQNNLSSFLASSDGAIELDYDPTTGTFIDWDINLFYNASTCTEDCLTGIATAEISILNCTAGGTENTNYCGNSGAEDSSSFTTSSDPGGLNKSSPGTFTPASSTVPEPASLALFGPGLALLLTGLLRSKLGRAKPTDG
jgi:hypothetical protein